MYQHMGLSLNPNNLFQGSQVFANSCRGLQQLSGAGWRSAATFLKASPRGSRLAGPPHTHV